MAKKYLNRIRGLDAEIACKMEELEQLRSLSEKVTAAISDEPRGGGISDKVGNSVGRILELQDDINELVDRYTEAKREAAKKIGRMSEGKHRLVLGYRYMNGMKWEEIAYKMGYEWAHIHRLHAQALRAFKDEIE